jgi:hypothetical protein
MPLVHECLLRLQRDGVVLSQRRRWKLSESARPKKPDPVARLSGERVATTGLAMQFSGDRSRRKRGGDSAAADQGNEAVQEVTPHPGGLSHTNSRWAKFRRLCQYYAECVRLDQGTTLHGKADQENWKFVCFGGVITSHMGRDR